MCRFCEPKIAPDKTFMTRTFSREGRKFRLTSHSALSAFRTCATRPLLNPIFLFVTWISKYLACGYWGTSKAHSSDRDRLQGQVWSPCFSFLKALILFRCKKKKMVSVIFDQFFCCHPLPSLRVLIEKWKAVSHSLKDKKRAQNISVLFGGTLSMK